MKSLQLQFQCKSHTKTILNFTYSAPKHMNPTCHSYSSDRAQILQIKLKSHHAKAFTQDQLIRSQTNKRFSRPWMLELKP